MKYWQFLILLLTLILTWMTSPGRSAHFNFRSEKIFLSGVIFLDVTFTPLKRAPNTLCDINGHKAEWILITALKKQTVCSRDKLYAYADSNETFKITKLIPPSRAREPPYQNAEIQNLIS